MNPIYDFKGQVALVTGAAKGMGLATARMFAESGASVVLADLDGDLAANEAERIVMEGGTAIGVACDVARARPAPLRRALSCAMVAPTGHRPVGEALKAGAGDDQEVRLGFLRSYELIPGSDGGPDGKYSTADLRVCLYKSGTETGSDVGSDCKDTVLTTKYINPQENVDGKDVVLWYCLRTHHFTRHLGRRRMFCRTITWAFTWSQETFSTRHRPDSTQRILHRRCN